MMRTLVGVAESRHVLGLVGSPCGVLFVAGKEAGGAMSVDTGSGADAGVAWATPSLADSASRGGLRPLPAPRGFLGFGGRRRSGWVLGISEVRGPAAAMRRDALFRRLLLVADVVAIVGAF